MTYKKRVAIWSRFLLQFNIIGRASCVSGPYCPLIDDVKFPTDEQDYLPDGLPRYIIIVLNNWKHRPAWHKLQVPNFRIRIYANHVDSRFCPLHWIFRHWVLEDISTGPMILEKKHSTYRNDLRRLFLSCGFRYTSHSIRRTASQWARRCGADISIIRNVGRWVSYGSLFFYIAEAERAAREAMQKNGNIDPLFGIWIFDTDTSIDTMNKPSTGY